MHKKTETEKIGIIGKRFCTHQLVNRQCNRRPHSQARPGVNLSQEAEINSRLPCLILPGPAMAARHASRLEPPLPDRTAPAAVSSPRLAGPGQGLTR